MPHSKYSSLIHFSNFNCRLQADDSHIYIFLAQPFYQLYWPKFWHILLCTSNIFKKLTYCLPHQLSISFGISSLLRCIIITQSSKNRSITTSLKHTFSLNTNESKSYGVKHVHNLLYFISPVILLLSLYFLSESSLTAIEISNWSYYPLAR